MGNGKWKVESGKWKVESREWRVESGEWDFLFLSGHRFFPFYMIGNFDRLYT
jgi:hypothetical protein